MAKMQKCKKSTKTTQKENTELPVVLPKATLKALEDERARLLKQLQPLQEKLDHTNRQIEQHWKATSQSLPPAKGRKAATKGEGAKVAETKKPWNIIEAPNDVLHAIFQQLSHNALILLSMTSQKALAIVDNAPPELGLWSDSLLVYEREQWVHGTKIKLSKEWGQEHAGKEAIKCDLTNIKGMQNRSNLLYARAVGATIRFIPPCGEWKKCHGRVTKVVAAEEIRTALHPRGRDSVLLDAGEKGLYVLTGSPPFNQLPPRVSAALELAKKCLMCKTGKMSRSLLSPSFPPSKRLLCQACFSDCTVSRKYVEKEMNVYDDRLLELSHLPFAFNYLSSKTYRGWWGGKPDEFLLKEDVAGLYQTTWELFVKDAAARATRRKHELKKKAEELKQQQKAEAKESTDLALRFAKFAGPLASSSDNFRVTASGNIAGLLTGTPTFTSLFYGSQERKEARKLLYSLEGGSSSALKAFKEKLVQEFNTREKLMLQEVIYIEIWKQVDNAQQEDFKNGFETWHKTKYKDHRKDIETLIAKKFQRAADSKALKIVLKGASIYGPSAYKIASDQDTTAEWKACFDKLETMLVKRLTRKQSFCPDVAPDPSGRRAQCAFCMRNRFAFQAVPIKTQDGQINSV